MSVKSILTVTVAAVALTVGSLAAIDDAFAKSGGGGGGGRSGSGGGRSMAMMGNGGKGMSMMKVSHKHHKHHHHRKHRGDYIEFNSCWKYTSKGPVNVCDDDDDDDD
jgi:hypothetical protein